MASTTDPTGRDRIDDVAPGDIVDVDRDGRRQPCRVVHKDHDDSDAGSYIVTFDDGAGATFQVNYPAGTCVTRSMQAKWESEQSATDDS